MDWEDRLQEFLALQVLIPTQASFSAASASCMIASAEYDVAVSHAQAICGDDFQFVQAEGTDLPEEYDHGDVEALLALEPPSGPVSLRCQALVRVTLEGPTTVLVGGDGGPCVFVRHLPPVCLRVLCPVGYPGSELPELEVWATWLPSGALRKLREELIRVGEEMKGMPILFEWVQWLKVGLRIRGQSEPSLLASQRGT